MNIDHAQEHPGMMTFNNSSIASLGSINGATELLREMKNDSGGAQSITGSIVGNH